MERMEHFKLKPESSKPSQTEIKKETEKKKSVVWNKIREYTKIATLSFFMSLPITESTLAQTKKVKKKDTKVKIEQLEKETSKYLKNIIPAIKKKGQPGKITGTMGKEIPLKRWQSLNGETVTTIGYSSDGNKAEWLIHEKNDGSVCYFDNNVDGKIDRAIINKNKTSSPQQKSAFNNLKLFDSMQNLAEEANITADLKPENVKVYNVSFEDGGYVVKLVDFKSGKAYIIPGPEGAKMAGQIQTAFMCNMKNINEQLEK